MEPLFDLVVTGWDFYIEKTYDWEAPSFIVSHEETKLRCRINQVMGPPLLMEIELLSICCLKPLFTAANDGTLRCSDCARHPQAGSPGYTADRVLAQWPATTPREVLEEDFTGLLLPALQSRATDPLVSTLSLADLALPLSEAMALWGQELERARRNGAEDD